MGGIWLVRDTEEYVRVPATTPFCSVATQFSSLSRRCGHSERDNAGIQSRPRGYRSPRGSSRRPRGVGVASATGGSIPDRLPHDGVGTRPELRPVQTGRWSHRAHPDTGPCSRSVRGRRSWAGRGVSISETLDAVMVSFSVSVRRDCDPYPSSERLRYPTDSHSSRRTGQFGTPAAGFGWPDTVAINPMSR